MFWALRFVFFYLIKFGPAKTLTVNTHCWQPYTFTCINKYLYIYIKCNLNLKVLKHLVAALKCNAHDETMQTSIFFALAMIGKHSSKHSKSIFTSGAVTHMLDVR